MQIIDAEYGLIVERVTFVPVGYVAACYVAVCPTGRNVFVKVWPNTPLDSDTWICLDASLRLTQAMYDRSLFTRLPNPILTTAGSRSSAVEGQPFALFPCLPGRVAPRWDQLSSNQRDQIARALAKIHSSTPNLNDVLPESETFAFRDEADLMDGLRAIERLPRDARPALRAARDLVLPRQEEIHVMLDRLHRLQQVVPSLAGPRVLVHTDMGGDNLLIDEGDQLYILDWDDAKIAPPEHDLQSGVGDGFGRFLKVYLEAGGVCPWHLAHFEFYLLRRYLGDMTARFHHLLTETTTDAEAADLLDGMEAWGFRQWDALDRNLAMIESSLREYGG
jgi:hypothetical protein